MPAKLDNVAGVLSAAATLVTPEAANKFIPLHPWRSCPYYDA